MVTYLVTVRTYSSTRKFLFNHRLIASPFRPRLKYSSSTLKLCTRALLSSWREV